MTDWPVYHRIDGPILMIGVGSIGRGTLPLIERHFAFGRAKLVVIDPCDEAALCALGRDAWRFGGLGKL